MKKSLFSSIVIATLCLAVLPFSGCKDEDPEINIQFEDQEFSISENSPANTVVGEVAALSNGSDRKFEIINGNEGDAFAIDEATGEITINDSSAVDFEKNEIFILTVRVESEDVEKSRNITIEVGDLGAPSQMLVSYYSFENNTEDQQSTNDGTAESITYQTRVGNDKSVAFSGQSYVHFQEDFDFTDRTISLWFNAANIASETGIIYSSDHPGVTKGMTILSVATLAGIPSLTFNVSNDLHSFPVAKDQWYHAVMVVDDKTYRLYIDGLEVGQASFDNYLSSFNGVTGSLLGCSRAFDRFFNGSVDNLYIYNRALTSREVEVVFHEQRNECHGAN